MKNRVILFQICLILLVTAVSFYPVLSNGFISLDDGIMLCYNVKVFDLTYANIIKYFAEFHWGLYHPLVLLSYAIEFKFFQFNPAIYHATNLYLHLFNCLLVYWLFLLLTEKKWNAFLISLLFGIHPLHVESVAWITERKDVLYSFFYLAASVSYIYYLKNDKNCKYYLITLLLFVLSLLSKPMAVSLPFLFFLFDHITEGGSGIKRLKDKVPFFLIASVFAFLTVFGSKPFAGIDKPFLVIIIRHCLEACYGIMLYIYKTFFPLKYSIYYSYFIDGTRLIKGYMWYSPFALSLIAAAVIYSAKYTKKVIYGGLFFVITLFPASNLVAFGFGFPAERFTYIPLIGFFYIFAEAAAWLIQKINQKKAVYVSAIAAISLIVAALSVATNKRCRQWKDTFSLFSGIIKEYPDAMNSKYAYNALANCYLDKGDVSNALKCGERSHQLDSSNPDYYCFMSRLACSKEDYKSALAYINEAITFSNKTKNNDSYTNLKTYILYKLGNYEQAFICADLLVKNEFFASQGHGLRGKIYYEMGNYEMAVLESSKAIEVNRFASEAYTTRCLSYRKLGKFDEAAADFKKLNEIETSYIKVGAIQITGSSTQIQLIQKAFTF